MAGMRIPQFQSTLSVRRATELAIGFADLLGISIHALRKESDVCDIAVSPVQIISIHALRKESDPAPLLPLADIWYFNPRSP